MSKIEQQAVMVAWRKPIFWNDHDENRTEREREREQCIMHIHDTKPQRLFSTNASKHSILSTSGAWQNKNREAIESR